MVTYLYMCEFDMMLDIRVSIHDYRYPIIDTRSTKHYIHDYRFAAIYTLLATHCYRCTIIDIRSSIHDYRCLYLEYVVGLVFFRETIKRYCSLEYQITVHAHCKMRSLEPTPLLPRQPSPNRSICACRLKHSISVGRRRHTLLRKSVDCHKRCDILCIGCRRTESSAAAEWVRRSHLRQSMRTAV